MAENRSEQATAYRKVKAREKGQVVRSRDLATALTLLATILALSWQPQLWVGRWRGLFERLLSAGSGGEIGLGTPIFSWTMLSVAECVAPILTLALAVSLLA